MMIVLNAGCTWCLIIFTLLLGLAIRQVQLRLEREDGNELGLRVELEVLPGTSVH